MMRVGNKIIHNLTDRIGGAFRFLGHGYDGHLEVQTMTFFFISIMLCSVLRHHQQCASQI
jgi:hypothetical protein